MKRYLIATLIGLIGSSTAWGQGWGDLTATFVLDGTPAAPKKFDTSKEPMCTPGGKAIYEEKLTVNKENKGIAHIAVYLFLKPDEKLPQIHPDYAKTEKDEIVLDNRQCRFEPHVLALRTTQKLIVKNSDGFGHNTNIAMFANPSQNPNLPAGTKVEFTFPKSEKSAAKVACNIHPWMNGYIILRDHPYVGISDANGKVTIKNLPQGKRTFQVWHEVGYVAEVKQGGKIVKWDRGRVDVDIKSGSNDLGEIHIDTKFFDKK